MGEYGNFTAGLKLLYESLSGQYVEQIRVLLRLGNVTSSHVASI